MTESTVDVTAIPRISHNEAMEITAVESRKFADLVRGFTAEDWGKPTDCTLWDVRALAAHVVGSAAAQASPREFVRQVCAGRRLVAEVGGEFWWDGMNEVQVRDRAALGGQELIAEWEAASSRALRARRRLPRPIARLPLLNLPAPVGRQPLSYLFDMGFTRDVWAHRIDLAVATGRPFDADEQHDGRIVADLVAEWAGIHGEPFTLDTGTRIFRSGTGGDTVHISPVDFVRTLAGRLPGKGVLRHPMPL